MKFAFKIICLLSLYSLSAAPKKVVATVNGEKIYLHELMKSYNQNLLVVSDKVLTKDKVLNDLINRKLGLAKAKKNQLHKNPVVVDKMNDILFHAQVSKDLEKQLSKIKVTKDDVKNYYKDHPEYRTAHILLRVRAVPEKKETDAALKQIMSLHKTLKTKPESFPSLANKFSQSSTAPNGGDLGFQPAIRMAPEYYSAIKGKKVGYITKPIRTQFGYHIIKVLGVKKFTDINEALYKKIVYDTKRDKIIAAYFGKMQRSAKIKIDKKVLQ